MAGTHSLEYGYCWGTLLRDVLADCREVYLAVDCFQGGTVRYWNNRGGACFRYYFQPYLRNEGLGLQQHSLQSFRSDLPEIHADVGGTIADFSAFCQLFKQENQGIKIACLEEIAFRMGFLTKENVIDSAKKHKQNEYYNYITNL